MGTVTFKDTFRGTMDQDWTWLHEAPEAWHVGWRALHIRALPGTLWGDRDDARNILLRPAQPVENGLASEVTIRNIPQIQGEQGGLIWYVDDANYVKLVKECLDGSTWIVLAREEDDKGTLVNRIPYPGDSAHLRLLLSDGKMVGQVQADKGGEWQTVGSCAPSETAEVRLGICVHGGSEDEPRWAELSTFKVRS